MSRGKVRGVMVAFGVAFLWGCSATDTLPENCIDRSQMSEDFNQELNDVLAMRLTSLSTRIVDLYPQEARWRGIQGTATLVMQMDRYGSLKHPVLHESSGSSALDRAALQFGEIIENKMREAPLLKDAYCFTETSSYLIPVDFDLSACGGYACTLPQRQ